MIESILLILIILAVFFMIFCIDWESWLLGFVDVIFWLVLAISIYNVTVPYQYIDPVTDEVVTASHTLQDMYPVGWLFVLLGVIMMVYSILLVWDQYIKGRPKRFM